MQLPTLVICPKIAITSWSRAAAVFGEKFSLINYEKLRTGNTPFGQWEHPLPKDEPEEQEVFVCENCQQKINPASCVPCYTNPAGLHCVGAPSRKKHDYGGFSFHYGVRMVIFDECHRCGGLHSLNSEMLIAAKRQRIYTLGLSATSACSPLQLRALGYVLDLHGLTPGQSISGQLGFYDWARGFGCRRDPRFKGLKWFASEARQIEIMSEIRERIIPCRGVRVRSSEIPGFPKRQIIAEEYDLDANGEVDKLYAEMAEAVNLLDTTCANDKNPDHPLTRILRARQRIELLKIPIAQSLHDDALAKGCSVAVFCNFRATIDELSKRLGIAAIIDGSVSGVRDRDTHIDAFQANRIRSILANNEAGGVALSLQDLRGDAPRVGLVFPNFSAVSMQQVFGRLPRDGGKSPVVYRVLFAAGTIESGIARALRSKSNNIESLNDGDMMPENFSLTKTQFLRTL
jgi:hypothetical protein